MPTTTMPDRHDLEQDFALHTDAIRRLDFDPFDATADEMAANTKFQARHIVETAPMSHRDLARLMAEKPRVRA